MAPQHNTANCNDCAAHTRVEQRIDWLYNHLLPWMGVLNLVQLLALLAVGAWITSTFNAYRDERARQEQRYSMHASNPTAKN
jgi:hypothetical protein